MPDWWQELVEIPEVDDHWELARKIQASFELPEWISELHDVENYHLALLAPPCLHQKDFLLPQDPKFPCHDIRMAQAEKTVAYVQALQFWAEKSHPPTPGQPPLLVGSVLELREVMESYISFPSDAILSSVAPLEGFLEDQLETTISGSAQPASADSPIEEAAVEEATQLKRQPWRRQLPLGGLRRNPVLPRPQAGSQPGGKIPQFSSLGGGKCYIPPGWLLPLDRPLQSPPKYLIMSQDGGLAARVLGKEGPDTKRQRSICGLRAQSQSPHCQLGHWKPHGK